MPNSLLVAKASGLSAVAVAAWLWFWPGSGREAVQQDTEATVPSAVASSAAVADDAAANRSPFSVETATVTNQPDIVLPPAPEDTVVQLSAKKLPELDVTRIGQAPMSDEDFESVVARLKSDPSLRRQLIDEFRQEQDPQRLALLARLLGEAGGAAITELASELIFSGDEASRLLGLQLLRHVQPGNAQARDMASGLLATEADPGVLMSTLTALATPGTVDQDSRAVLSDQVALLASHADAGVRGVSLDILSRWSTDGRDTPVLINGLLDPEPRVRESAAYALVDHENQNGAVVESLFTVVRNVDEPRATRSAAFMALKSFTLNSGQREELQNLERDLNTVRRR